MIAQASPAAGPLRADPSKRVNYTLGLVLGVDEFQQDQLYHAAGRRGHNRLLHGYGTVWGLRTAFAGGAGDPEVQVDPGIAIDPCGREICVADRMCVKLNRWLDRHRPVLEPLYPDIAAQPLPLAIVLCHRECPTDTVPVPGEPCRTQEDAMAPSRIRESFELKLALRDDAPWGSPPALAPTGLTIFRLSQPEEQAVRAFGLLLARVQSTTDEALGQDGEAALLAGVWALRDAASEGTLASPPAPTDDPILLPAAQAPDILRRALRLWVTEVRPAIRALEDPGAECAGQDDGECCVLLAEMDLHVTGSWAVAVNQPPLREDLRPYLLHTRLLQEWLIAQGGEEGRPDVDSWASLQILGPNRIRTWVHHAEWVDLPAEALTVLVNDVPLDPSQVTEVPWGGIRNVWDIVISQEMSDGDVVEVRFDTELIPLVHGPAAPQPERTDEVFDELPARRARRRPVVRELGEEAAWSPADAERTGVTVADELRGPTGEYLDRYGWSLSAFTVYDRIQGGDLEGEYKLPIVVKIQKFPVDPATPLADQYLVSDGAKWLPRYLPDGTRDLQHRYPDSIVRGIQGTAVSATAPVATQYLYFDGTSWVPAHLPDGRQDLSGRYPESTVTGLQTTPVSNAQPGKDQYLFYDQVSDQWIPAHLPDATGDLVGRYPSLEIAKLQKNEVAAANPQANQALAFVGGRWVPAGVATLLGQAGGDLRGTYPAPNVVGLRGRPIAPGAPSEGDVLVYREGGSPPGAGAWTAEPIAFSGESDLGGAYPDNQLARLQGNTLDAAAPLHNQVLRYHEPSSPAEPGRWVPSDLPPTTPTGDAAGDLAGEYPKPTIAALQGRTLDARNPEDGQVLQYVDSSPSGNGTWVPVHLSGDGGLSGIAGGDLSGTYPNPRILNLQGKRVFAAEPQDGQVLVYRESSPAGNGFWQTMSLPGGGGISGPAAGDLSGEWPFLRIEGLQGTRLDISTLENGHYLRYDGRQKTWEPAHAVSAPAPYGIVAAGVFDVRVSNGDAIPHDEPFGGLKLVPQRDGTFTLEGFPYNPERFIYVVKALAQDSDVQLVREGSVLGIRVPGIVNSDGWAEVHVEVSAYPRSTAVVFPPVDRLGTRATQPGGGGTLHPGVATLRAAGTGGTAADADASAGTADSAETEATGAAEKPAAKTTRATRKRG